MLQDQNQNKQRFGWVKKTSEYCALSATLCLTGCMGVYEGGFECPPGEGVGCKSISEVNSMVDHGDLPKGPLSDVPQAPCKRRSSDPHPDSQQKDYEKSHIWYSPWVLEEV